MFNMFVFAFAPCKSHFYFLIYLQYTNIVIWWKWMHTHSLSHNWGSMHYIMDISLINNVYVYK